MDSQIINGNTQLIGLIGNPISHSISPIIHNHAFKKLNLPYAYIPMCVKKNRLVDAVNALHSLNFVGANVTIPYKKDILQYCDVVSELSQLTGTVNTLYFNKGNLHGTTTDAEGFFAALTNMSYHFKNENIVILGNGGTARTLSFALTKFKEINSLTIIGRNSKRVEDLCLEVNKKSTFSISPSKFKTKKCEKAIKNCTLLINCTSVGMYPNINQSPIPEDLFNKNMTVFDTIYNPLETLFLKNARNAGCHIQNGLYMLLFQGLASSKYWTGITVKKELFDQKELQSLLA